MIDNQLEVLNHKTHWYRLIGGPPRPYPRAHQFSICVYHGARHVNRFRWSKLFKGNNLDELLNRAINWLEKDLVQLCWESERDHRERNSPDAWGQNCVNCLHFNDCMRERGLTCDY